MFGLLLSIDSGQAAEQHASQHGNQYRNHQANDYAADNAPQKSRKQIDENQQTSPVSPLTTKTQTADDESTEQQDNPGDQNQQSASVSISTPIRIGSQANQMSLVLVGAIFVGLIMIVGLVLGRRR